MKIGVCSGIDIEKAKLAKEIGYDYIEAHCQNIVKATEEELKQLKEVGIPVYAANCFIGMRVVGPDKDDKAINEYLSALFERSNYLGIKTLVFGSSGARKALDGQDIEECREEITDFISRLVVPYCEKYDINLVIEPLRTVECNVISTVPQAVEIAKKVNNKYVKALADVKHMAEMNDPFDKLPDYKGLLLHAHTSNPYPDGDHKRIYPRVGDGFDQDLFIKPLIEAGVEYCSIEAEIIDVYDDFKASYEVLKSYR